MGIFIREGTINDVSGIAKVHVDSWNTTYKNIVPDDYLKSKTYKAQEERWLKRYFKNPETREFLYVAVSSENQVVGFACGSTENEDPEHKGKISCLYLLESYQRQGIGKRLVKKMVERLNKEKIEKMIIWVIEDNPSCRFYEHIGGVKAKEENVNIGGRDLVEIGYSWNNLAQLITEL